MSDAPGATAAPEDAATTPTVVVSEGAVVLITEDASSLARYVDFANKRGLSEMFAWTLDKGFDTQVAKGQQPDLMSNQA